MRDSLKAIDEEMRQGFDELQQQCDSTLPWQDWDDTARLTWYEWCIESGECTAADKRKLNRWRKLAGF